ncbi:MAG: hypothetical protein U0167_13690 [bacterium]
MKRIRRASRDVGAAAGRVVAGVIGATALAGMAAPSRAESVEETKAQVPALSAFHEVIFPLWHTAWATKDTAMVRTLWPDVQAHVAAVKAAELPGILRDKKEAWQKGLDELSAAEAMYGKALESKSIEDELAAVEKLHGSFEGLVRVVRPVLPELAGFHEVLYRIYHYDLPQKDKKALVERLPALAAARDSLNAAVLPERRAAAKEKFEAARAELSAKVDALAKIAPGEDWDATALAIEEMHSAYQAVEKVFD